MISLKCLCVLVFPIFIATPCAHAQEPGHDWQILELLGWYDRLAGKTGIVSELHVERDTITRFNRKNLAHLKWRGEFEKLNLNQFVFIPSKVTDEKGGSFLSDKGWCHFMSIEVLQRRHFRPGEYQVISMYFFMSEADARANVKTCGGGTYSFYGLEHRDASN